MARKRHSHEQELPFVALMDTMTNVVGVLTIVLVMVGISLARSANRVISALPPVTEAQVRAAQTALDRIRVDQDKMKVALPVLTPAQQAALEAELAKLEQATKGKNLILVDLDALKRELAKREAELKQKKDEADGLMTERAQIKARLDTMPSFKPPPAKVVHLPTSRPIPEGAKIEHMIATRDGVFWVDIEGARETVLKEFKSSAIREMKKERVKQGNETVVVYDYKLLARYFEKQKLATNDFRINVLFPTYNPNPVVKLIPREKPSAAGLQTVLRHVKEISNTIVMFHVTGDGFENYLVTRERLDRINAPAGWDYAAGPEYQFVLGEILTNQPKPPPPPPPVAGAVPPPPPQNVIKNPTPKLD